MLANRPVAGRIVGGMESLTEQRLKDGRSLFKRFRSGKQRLFLDSVNPTTWEPPIVVFKSAILELHKVMGVWL